MKTILLTQGKVAFVDNQDFKWLSQWKWHFDRHSNGIGGYARRKLPGDKHLRMHVAIARYLGLSRVDHKNQNKLDNRRCNLRPATSSQNAVNRTLRRNNKSGFRGVSWYKQTKRWHAQITIQGKVRHIGYFAGNKDGKCAAARAYNREAVKAFGMFALLNEV